MLISTILSTSDREECYRMEINILVANLQEPSIYLTHTRPRSITENSNNHSIPKVLLENLNLQFCFCLIRFENRSKQEKSKVKLQARKKLHHIWESIRKYGFCNTVTAPVPPGFYLLLKAANQSRKADFNCEAAILSQQLLV